MDGRQMDDKSLEEWLDSPADALGYGIALAIIVAFVFLAFIIAG